MEEGKGEKYNKHMANLIAMITTWYFLFVVSSLLIQAFASPLLGISPQDEKYYMDGAMIYCKDGSKSFPRSRLNDDFCDCPDGTDEPGTSACPQGKFYCRNSGDTPRFLFSSRVNDRICDCCDGSDEYNSGVSCANTCTKDEYDTKIDTDKKINTEEQILERMNRHDVEDFIRNFKGFRFAIMVELMVLICLMISYILYRRNRAQRRRVIRRS